MTRRPLVGFVALSAMLIALWPQPACSPAGPSAAGQPAGMGFPLAVTDDIGRQVRLERPPQRLVSLAPSNTETLFALGVGDRVVGVTQYCDYPDEAKSRPQVGGYATVDIERVVSLSPDLVFVTRVHEKEVLPALERVGLKLIAVHPRTLPAMLESMKLVGLATGKSGAASRLTADLSKRIEAVASGTRALGPDRRPRVLYVNWPDPIKSAGGDTFADDLIQKAGGVNIAHDLTGYASMTLETIVSRNPEVIVLSGMSAGPKAIFNAIMSESRLSGTDARRSGRVYEIEGPLFERPGPRLVLGLEQLARHLHPEIFGPG